MNTFTTPGPALLASALINGDESGLSDEDRVTLDWFRRYIDGAAVVGIEQPGGTLVEYTCTREVP
jgi:hypothetical protein